jgi:riboflavin biosynthesis pyrimidine reductase
MSATTAPRFETFLEAPGLPRFDLPEALEASYGRFGLPEQVVYANFVASVDGIVAVPERRRSSALISGGDLGDRFVVALLRACADAVVIGAGTFRAHGGPWTAENAYPDAAKHFAELRRCAGMAPAPTLVVVSGSGRVEGPQSKLRGAIVATTAGAAQNMREPTSRTAEIWPVGETDMLNPGDVVAALSERGYRRILTEGGPTLMGQLLRAGAVDELFLTISPVMAGGGENPRPTLATGVDLLASGSARAHLLSGRRHGSYLFLRYACNPEDHEGTARSGSTN